MYRILTHFLAIRMLNLLAAFPGLTVSELQNKLAAESKKPTPQAIYKELRKLQAQLAVFKSKDRFYLSLPSLFSAQTDINQTIDIYSKEEVLHHFLPGPGETQKWHFSEIHAMDRLVVNLLVVLLNHGQEKEIYHWDPYPWYAVFHRELAAPFLKQFLKAGFKAYGVLGARSPIAEEIQAVQRRFGHTWRLGRPPFTAKEHTAFSVKAPYVLTIRYPEEALKVFRTLFNKSELPTEREIAAFHDLHFRKLSYSVTLSHSLLKAQRLTAAFRKLFKLQGAC